MSLTAWFCVLVLVWPYDHKASMTMNHDKLYSLQHVSNLMLWCTFACNVEELKNL